VGQTIVARTLFRLTARSVTALDSPGRYADGGGLYLFISANGGKRWTFMYRRDGKRHELGLGSARTVPLTKARETAHGLRLALHDGLDPGSIRRTRAVAKARTTFWDFAARWLDETEGGLKSLKHRAQWRMTLSVYAAPLHKRFIDEVSTDDVLDVLKPIWSSKQETASRVRGRVERVLDAAKAKGLRSGENPARWRGHLDHLLPRPGKLTRGHHAAMPFDTVPTFVAALRQAAGVSSRALEFTILTAARTSEVVGAQWSEIDLDAAVWTVPKVRIKSGREHRVPLPSRAVEILQAMSLLRSGDENGFVFPGPKPGKPLSTMAMTMQMRRMKKGDYTVHGFRSAFRDWAGERTTFPREVAEAALAHVVGDATERAYRRGDALEKRRELMNAWAEFVVGDR
jgi:integrase